MKSELLSQFQLSCRGQQIFLSDFSVFCSIHFPFYLEECPSPYWWETSPITWCCHHHHASQYGWCSLGDVLCWFAPNVTFCIYAKKFHLGIVKPLNVLPHGLKIFTLVFFCIPQTGLEVGFLSNGFLLTTPPYRPGWLSAWDIVVTCTQWPVFAIKACSSFKVAIGLLVASLISLLLAWSSSLEGRLDLGRVLVVPYTFHFLMIVLTVLQGIFKATDIFLYPSLDLCLSTTISRRSFESSLALMVESFVWNARPSRGNRQEQLILFWNNKTSLQFNKGGGQLT